MRYVTLKMCDLNLDVNDLFLLAIYFRFWDSSLPLFYLKSVARTIPLFLIFLFSKLYFYQN